MSNTKVFEVGKRYRLAGTGHYTYGKILEQDTVTGIFKVRVQPVKGTGAKATTFKFKPDGKLYAGTLAVMELRDEYHLPVTAGVGFDANGSEVPIRTKSVGPHTCVPVDTGFPTFSKKWCRYCDRYM